MQHRPQSHKRVLSLAVSAALGVGSINAFAQAIEEETLEAAAASEISEDNKVVEEVM